MNKKNKGNKMIKEMEITKIQNNIEREKNKKAKKNKQRKGIIEHHMIHIS
jgi:hypothetical protein